MVIVRGLCVFHGFLQLSVTHQHTGMKLQVIDNFNLMKNARTAVYFILWTLLSSGKMKDVEWRMNGVGRMKSDGVLDTL